MLPVNWEDFYLKSLLTVKYKISLQSALVDIRSAKLISARLLVRFFSISVFFIIGENADESESYQLRLKALLFPVAVVIGRNITHGMNDEILEDWEETDCIQLII